MARPFRRNSDESHALSVALAFAHGRSTVEPNAEQRTFLRDALLGTVENVHNLHEQIKKLEADCKALRIENKQLTEAAAAAKKCTQSSTTTASPVVTSLQKGDKVIAEVIRDKKPDELTGNPASQCGAIMRIVDANDRECYVRCIMQGMPIYGGCCQHHEKKACAPCAVEEPVKQRSRNAAPVPDVIALAVAQVATTIATAPSYSEVVAKNT